MQDSTEDYIRISRNTKDGPVTLEIRKNVLLTAQVKRDCDARAIRIVQFAIEGKLRPEAVFKCLPFIDQSHYQDIVEERAITKLCGYPLCGKKIPLMPTKQYHIAKTNKVYDITERKNFCSNYCYHASSHLKSQVESSPLWLRKFDHMPVFTLLNKMEGNTPGTLITEGVAACTTATVEEFTSVSHFTHIALDHMEKSEYNPVEKTTQKIPPLKKKSSSMGTISENDEQEEEVTQNQLNETISDKPVIIKNKPKVKKTPTTETDAEKLIVQCFQEWITLETITFIHGESEVKSIVNSEKVSDYFDSLHIEQLQIEQQKKYMKICRELHMRELAEEKFHNSLLSNGKRDLIPDYHKLKQETSDADVRVKSFYSGQIHVRDTPKLLSSSSPSDEKNEEENIVLPLVDISSQRAIRRRIFLNSLNKTMQILLQNLRVSPSSILHELQGLVKTFNLKADNIVLKPTVWNYVALILLKFLCLKDSEIRRLLEEERCLKYFNVVLSSLSNNGEVVDDIVKIVTDIESFVMNFISCSE